MNKNMHRLIVFRHIFYLQERITKKIFNQYEKPTSHPFLAAELVSRGSVAYVKDIKINYTKQAYLRMIILTMVDALCLPFIKDKGKTNRKQIL